MTTNLLLLALLACALPYVLCSDDSALPLVQGGFSAGNTAGWSTAMLNGLPTNFQPSADVTGLLATDTGNMPWYFVAPDTFKGNFVSAYNGKLTFKIVHAEVADANAEMISGPTVALEASCGHSLTWTGRVQNGVTVMVMLNEDAGWKDTRTGRTPSSLDFFGVLNHLQTIKIKGGFFSSAETTRLESVAVSKGKAWFPCCDVNNDIDVCVEPPSAAFTPPSAAFYCQGSQRQTIKISKVSPRFSRRTGGAVITVTGENFGMAGTEPIVRVDGKPCQKTWFPPSKVITGTLASGRQFGDVVLNNKERNALLNAYEAATDSMRAVYPEHCWNGMLDDGTDTGYNYGTAAAPKYLNQGETGIDTGGPCFPSHCSSCPDNSKEWCSANQIVAVGSGVCKGRGNEDLACAVNFPYVNFPRMCPDDAERPLASNIISQAPTSGLSTNQFHDHKADLSLSDTAVDLLDILATTLSAAATATDTSITVADATALVCENMNDAATRNCTTGSTSSSNDLIENYVKIYDKATGSKEVVKVTAVTGATLTVTRGQGETMATAFASGAEVRMCGRLADCIISADLEGGRFVKIDDEIMQVTNAGGITYVSLSAARCGSGYNDSLPLNVTCTGSCNSTTSLAGYVVTDGFGRITSVTITDSGSGYSPLNLPTVEVGNGTGCTLTPWWSSLKLARGQAGTTAVAHAATPLTVVRLNCLDSVETGENCGGTCKPCQQGVLAPPEQNTLLCVTPEWGQSDSTLSLPVTVEASPGPKFSPYAVRMNYQQTAWEDKNTAAISCISEFSRGFLYGSHDAVWGVAASSTVGSVHITGMAVDQNQGEVYVVGTMQTDVKVQGKHLLTELMGGALSVSPATAADSTCTGAAEARHDIAGVGNADCGRASFISKMDKDGRAVWLTKIESRGTSDAKHQAVITDASFDQTNSELYLVGYFGDGDHAVRDSPTLHLFDIDTTTRTAAAAASTTLAAASLQINNLVYQEGFLAKYSRVGAVMWAKSIGAARIPNLSGMTVSDLKVFCYKASTSHIINTHLQGSMAPPNQPTQARRQDIEYDKGQVVASVQGGTVGGTSSVTLKSSSSTTNGWYNGLMIEITNGPGYGQKRTIFEYDGSTQVARVQPHWDPNQFPTSFSTYRIVGGRPTSWIQGTHWSNGGVYVTGQVTTLCGTDCTTSNNKTASSVRIGTMPTDYENSNAPGTAKLMQLSMAQDDHLNFLAQFDNTGAVFWTRAIGVNGHSGYVQAALSDSRFNISADASTEDGYYVGATITLTDGSGAGESRVITNYTGATRYVVLNYNFSVAPDTTTRYIISSRGTAGRVAAGTTTTVQLQVGPSRSELTGAYVGQTLLITAGTGLGQLATVQAYDGSSRTATVSTLATAPDSSSYFQILDAAGIKGVAAMEDRVFVTGFYTASVRHQNCSFDSATVLEGPPENTHPTYVFECGVVGGSPPSASPDSATKTEAVPHGSASTDVASISMGATTTWGIFTVAFNGSGAIFWAQNASEGAVMPKAIAVMDPLIAGRPLAGQPGDATHPKDIHSEKYDTAVARGRYVYVAGEVYDWTNAADFGRTVEPVECSAGYTIGEKGLSTARLRKAACAGKVVATGTSTSWPQAGVNAGQSDVVVVAYAAETGQVQQVRRLGQKDKTETVASMTVHALTGAVYIGGSYYTSGAAQGSETAAGGEDVFGLVSAKRRQSVGCPRQRWEGSLELGESGKPDCRLYSHSASATTETGYLLKLNYNGDETNRGNLNRREIPSVTGHIKASSTLAACSGGTADTDGTLHVLTGTNLCSTHTSGCSCLHLAFESRTFAATAVDSDDTTSPYGPGPDSKLSGYKIRITAGKSMGYEGVISAYTASSGIYNVVPSLHAELVDETSKFQLIPLMQFLPRNHLASCDKVADMGCNSYGVEWVKTVGYTIGSYATASITGAASAVAAIAEMDSDIYVGGGFEGFLGQPNDGAAFGIEGVDELVGYANPSATEENSYLVRFQD